MQYPRVLELTQEAQLLYRDAELDSAQAQGRNPHPPTHWLSVISRGIDILSRSLAIHNRRHASCELLS